MLILLLQTAKLILLTMRAHQAESYDSSPSTDRKNTVNSDIEDQLSGKIKPKRVAIRRGSLTESVPTI